MPELDYELSSGLSSSKLLNMRLDTKERMRDLTEGFNIPDYQPPKPFIPKTIDGDTLIKGHAELPNLQEALYSKDPEIASAAALQAKANAANDPTAKGLGMRRDVLYQEGQNKFTSKHWWKEDNQTMYGFDPTKSIAQNEDFLHTQLWDNYSVGGQIWRGVGTFAGRTLSKLVTGLVGTVGDLGAIAWNGLQEVGDLMNINDGTKNNFWEDVSNNWLSRQMEAADQYTKNSILPTYKALDYDNKGAWSKLMDPYTWTGSFADGAGFLLQFAIPGAAFGSFAKAGKLSRMIGLLEESVVAAEATGNAAKIAKATMTLEKAKNVSGFTRLMGAEISGTTKFGKTAGNVSEFLTGSKDVGGISAHLFNTSMEAVSETKSGFDDTVRDLMEKGMSREEAVRIAGENAPSQFWINMGILSASNAFENKLLQKAVGNRGLRNIQKLGVGTEVAEKEASTVVGKFFRNNTWGNRISYYGKNAIKASIMEGYWEENAQTAASRWARGSYIRKGDDTNDNGVEETTQGGLVGFFKQMYKQTIDAAQGKDREAADSIMAGVVIGVLGGTTMTKISGERKAEFKDKANHIAKFRNNKDAWLELNTLSSDIYDKDGKIDQKKADERAEQINQKLEKIQSVFARTVTGESLIDPHQREVLQHQVFADYVKAHIMNDTHESLVHRLRNWNKTSESELSLYGVSPEMKQDATKWADVAEKLIDKWNEIKDIKYGAPKDETVDSYLNKSHAIKSLIFDYTALAEMSKTLAQRYSDLKDEVNPFTKFADQQAYNEQFAHLQSLEQTLKEEDVPFRQEKIQLKIDQVKKELSEKKKNLTDLGKSKEDVSGFMFPKEVDPKDEFKDMNDINNYLTYQWYQTQHEEAAKTHEDLVKEYSDEKTGIEKYNKVVDYWDNERKKLEEGKQDEEDTKDFKSQMEVAQKELEDLQISLAAAESQDQKDEISAKIKEKEAEIEALKTKFDKDETDLDEPPVETDEEPLPEDGDQLGAKDYQGEALANETPFKTGNSETRNAKNEEEEYLDWKEYVLAEGYDHALTEFVKEFAKDPEKYDVFVIGDNEELLTPRLSKEQMENFLSKGGKYGAVLVFKEKGKDEFVKFDELKGSPIVAFSYNKLAFEDQKLKRAQINADRTGRKVQVVLKEFEREQKIANKIREMVIEDPSLQVPIKATLGSLGVFPITREEVSAFSRFEGFHNNEIRVVENTNDFPTDLDLQLSDIVLVIPKSKTDSGLEHFIPVHIGSLSLAKGDIRDKIHDSLQAVNSAKFATKAEGDLIIQSFLNNLFYVNTSQFFKTIPVGKEWKIVYYKIDAITKKRKEHKVFTTLKLKMSKKIYDGDKVLNLYTKEPTTGKFIPNPMSTEDYKKFVHSSLTTNKKVITSEKKGVGDVIYTKRVNAYLNLSSIGEIEISTDAAEMTTEDQLSAMFDVKPPVSKTTTPITPVVTEVFKDVATTTAALTALTKDNTKEWTALRDLVFTKAPAGAKIEAITPAGVAGYYFKIKTEDPEDIIVVAIEKALTPKVKEVVTIPTIRTVGAKFSFSGSVTKKNSSKSEIFDNTPIEIVEAKGYKNVEDWASDIIIFKKLGTEELYYIDLESQGGRDYKTTPYIEPTEVKFKNAIEAALNTKDGDILRLTTTNPSAKGHHGGTKGNTQTSSTTLVKVGDVFVEQEDLTKVGRDRREYKPENLDKNNKTLVITKIGESVLPKKDISKIEETDEKLKETLIQKREDLKKAEELLIERVAKASTPQLVKLLTEQESNKVNALKEEISKLEALLPKEDRPLSPLQELRAEMEFDEELPNAQLVTTIRSGKIEYEIDFTNNVILPKLSVSKGVALMKVLDKAHSYTVKSIDINGNNVYLVKYNKSGKFVILDSEYKNIPETKEMMANTEYKKFKECK